VPLAWLWRKFKAEPPQIEDERRASEAEPAPLAWLWSQFKGEHPQSEDERRALKAGPVPLAWLWSQFKGEQPQSEDERRASESGPAPLAWLWSQFKGEHPQSEGEKRALKADPVPLAWLWSQFKGEHPQSEDERRTLEAGPVPLAWLWSQFRGEHPQSEAEKRAPIRGPEVEEFEWRAQSKALQAKLDSASSRSPDEVSRSSVRLSPGSEAAKPVSRMSDIPTRVARGKSSRLSWFLTAAAIILTGGVAWRVLHWSNEAAVSPNEELRPSTSGETRIGSPEITSAEAQKISPAPQNETAQTGAVEASINPPGGARATPAQEMSSTPSIEPMAQQHEEAGSIMTPAQTAGDHFTQIKLPNGIELAVPSSGVENKLFGFLKQASNKSGEFDMDRISFDAAHATLSPSSSEQLQNVAKILGAYPNTRITINAYVDNASNKIPGLRLSRERANSMLRELVWNGVEKSRMATEVYSSYRAKRSSGSEKGQRRDQHISLTVTRK
jgi:outer membrane protein OmpA-like peptidoglycan-associated protein